MRKLNYTAFVKLPFLMHDVQTLAFLTAPLGRTILTGCKLGICLYMLCLCENDNFEAFFEPFPHISQITDILSVLSVVVSSIGQSKTNKEECQMLTEHRRSIMQSCFGRSDTGCKFSKLFYRKRSFFLVDTCFHSSARIIVTP